MGPDITLLAWQRRRELALPAFVLFADPAAMAARAARLGIDAPVRELSDPREAPGIFATRLPIIPVPLAAAAVPGRPDPANGTAIVTAIEHAAAAVATGTASALVTNPIAKSVLYRTGFAHPGHTEFLAELARRHVPGRDWRSVMMLVGGELRVVPLTIHVPLATVPAAITRELIEATARVTAAALEQDFGIGSPRIVVAGLNPHAGEDGAMGSEDRDVIAPAIAVLRAEGLRVTGPHPADSLFHTQARREYDAVLAMYHDQAIIPVKTLAFDTAVNVTLGLPFVRTSPDHGTAFAIAGSGRASPASLVASLRMAAEIAARRARRPQ